ncbi:hypothetical protein [Spirosoma endophyticum]|uniref:Uncharacterized protein n=1 Tax=Spirosoma endophyticum TaxID=662367 RepID=A0A1I1UDZ9_9BACT|nr:hypothetical protein [Spirosoma endophyticum]SFD67838.1 hypothetical protein SAMN05216167_106193 [Spirosoma endophyticum]
MNKNVFYLLLFGLILYLFLRKKQQTAEIKAAQAVAEKSTQLGTTTANGQTTVAGGTTTVSTPTGVITSNPVNPNTPTTQPVQVEENINYVKFYEDLTT